MQSHTQPLYQKRICEKNKENNKNVFFMCYYVLRHDSRRDVSHLVRIIVLKTTLAFQLFDKHTIPDLVDVFIRHQLRIFY